jgi:hypothetical protein
MDAGDSTIHALEGSGSTGKIVALGGIVVVALGAAAWFGLGLGGSRGAPDKPHTLLIVGPEQGDLVAWINDRGFAAEQLEYSAAVDSGRAIEPELDDLEAIVALADEKGAGYVAIHPPELHDFSVFGGPAQAPEGATMAIVSVGDIADESRVTFGIPSRAVEHVPPSGVRVGLLVGLFEQPYLKRIADGELEVDDLEVMQALQDKDTVRRYQDLAHAQREFEATAAAWEQAAALKDSPKPTSSLGGAFEGVDGYPLANGGIVALVASPRWLTEDGMRSRLEERTDRIARYIPPDLVKRTRDGSFEPGAGQACGPLDADEVRQLRVNDSGNALALQRFVPDSNIEGEPSTTGSWVIQFVKLGDLPQCPFAITGYPIASRQMYELGAVDPSGAMLMPSDRMRFGLKGSERSWNYPVLAPDGSAAAWVDSTLAVFAGSPVYEDSDAQGLAFMSSLTENRLEAFFPMSSLLPDRDADTLQIVHVQVVDPQTYALVVADRSALSKFLVEVTFDASVRKKLHTVDHTGDMPKQLKKLTYGPGNGVKARVIADPMPDFESASFDAKAQRLAYVHDGKAWIMDLRQPGAQAIPISSAGDVATHVRLSPDGRFAIYHRVVSVADQQVPTANVVWIE